MKLNLTEHRRGGYFLLLIAVLATGAGVVLPKYFRAEAVLNKGRAKAITELPNYDIRLDKKAVDTIAEYRGRAARSVTDTEIARARAADGESQLRQAVPNLRVATGRESRNPEVIATDVTQGKAFLTRASNSKRPTILKSFISANRELFGTDIEQVARLRTASTYANPDGNMSFVDLRQEVNGVPVFRGRVRAGFTRRGEMVRVVNELAPDVMPDSTSTDFGEPSNAVAAAAANTNSAISTGDLRRNDRASSDSKSLFSSEAGPISAEKIYFPLDPGVLVPAWRVMLWQGGRAYYVVTDANSGTMLWRKCLTSNQTQSSTYGVYLNSVGNVSILGVSRSPFPYPSGPGATSTNGSQGTAIARTSIALKGNEAPYTFNQNGWITDGNNTTDGNNVQAGLDRELPSDIFAANPADTDPNSLATGSPSRNFVYTYNPAVPTNPASNSGDAPLQAGQTAGNCPGAGTSPAPSQYQQGVVTQLFYLANRFHDETYLLGFNESAGNYQTTNFTGQGLGNDRISIQAQDCRSANNAGFTTPADGSRGTLEVGIFTGPPAGSPDIDAGFDSEVIVHELTHGLSNRLIGNGDGLFNDMSSGMGEGWSDFYSLALLSQPNDPVNGVYPEGAYASYWIDPSFYTNYYYGIRRFPYAVLTATGSNGKPHNPLTFKDIDVNQIDLSDGAFGPAFNNNADEVHNIGEVWCSMLWEVRARMVTRLGWSVGNKRALQIVTDAMKLTPVSPTFLDARDAIVSAAFATGSADDVDDVWAGFASRGLGASATIQNVGGISVGGGGLIRVTEANDLPNLDQTPTISVSDAVGDNDKYPEPGEAVTISIPIRNATGKTATSVTAAVAGGGSASYGTLTGASSGTQGATYTIPANTPCGSVVNVTINVNSSLGPKSFIRSFLVGKPPAGTTPSQNFDGVPAPTIPTGWTATSIQSGVNFVTSTAAFDSAPNAAFAADPNTVGGGSDLVSPYISVTSSAATVSFRHNFNTEDGWDGGAIDISIAGGPYQDFRTAGGTFTQNGYNGVLGPGDNNPLANRYAWTGTSGGFVTTGMQLPASAVNKVVRLKWRFGADDNTAATGWYVDSIALSGAGFFNSFACDAAPTAAFVNISGRVIGVNGRGLAGALVSLTDSISYRSARTNSLGRFTFTGVQAGPTYVISVGVRDYIFESQLVPVTGNVTNLTFTGNLLPNPPGRNNPLINRPLAIQ